MINLLIEIMPFPVDVHSRYIASSSLSLSLTFVEAEAICKAGYAVLF